MSRSAPERWPLKGDVEALPQLIAPALGYKPHAGRIIYKLYLGCFKSAVMSLSAGVRISVAASPASAVMLLSDKPKLNGPSIQIKIFTFSLQGILRFHSVMKLSVQKKIKHKTKFWYIPYRLLRLSIVD